MEQHLSRCCCCQHLACNVKVFPDSGNTVTLRVRARVRPKQRGKGFVNVKYDPLYWGKEAIIKRVGTTDQRSSKKLTKIVPSNDILKESFSPADFDLQASSSSSSSSLAASAASLEMTMMSANSHFLNDKNFFEEPLSFIYNTRQKFLLNILWT